MEYINSFEASQKWHISQRRIIKLAKEGRISGARQLGRNWLIPGDSKKPIDGRTKQSKVKEDNEHFLYPSYAFTDLTKFGVSLSDEEVVIKDVMEAYYSCEFDKANSLLGDFPDKAKNIYCRIYALYERCMIDIYRADSDSFLNAYQKLYSVFLSDFPYKKEMSYLIEELNASVGFDDYFKNGFGFETEYSYHQSFLPHLASLCAVTLFYHYDQATIMDIKEIELACKFLEKSDNITDLQTVYLYLGNTYGLLNKNNEMRYYYSKLFDLSIKYDSYYPICQHYYFMSSLFDTVLSDYPEEFRNKVRKLSADFYKRYVSFSDKLSINSIYSLLPGNYYPLVYYAVAGYTNKEIADIMHISENTVNRKYSQIYDIAGVKNKNELIILYNKSIDISVLTRKN